MCTPLGWLERVPTYKDQQEKLSDRDLATYGFLGYPLLQAADILMYRASWVPVGEDQVPHIELTREVARRFNHLFGRETGFEEKAKEAIKKLGSKRAQALHGAAHPLPGAGRRAGVAAGARAARRGARTSGSADRERLFGYLEGTPQDDPVRATGAAHRGVAHARHRRAEDEQELRQRDRDARGPGIGHEEDPDDADRSGARAAHRRRRSRALPGLAAAPGLLGRRHRASGSRTAAAAPASAAWTASSR